MASSPVLRRGSEGMMKRILVASARGSAILATQWPGVCASTEAPDLEQK